MTRLRPPALALVAAVVFLGAGKLLDLLALAGPARCPVVEGAAAHDVARAIPAFARKFNLPCSTCHLAPPYLNATGRKFMEAGYRMPDENGAVDEDMQNHQDINDNLALEKMLPLALRVRSLLSDATGEKPAFLPLSDYNLLALGNFFRYGSFQIGLGGEAGGGFVPAADGRLGIHPSPYANVVAGYSPVLAADPYNTFRTDDLGLTQTSKSVFTDGHASGINFVDDSEFVEAYGRAGMVFYEGGLVGPPNALGGDLPQLGVARIAVDPVRDLSFGAFGFGGRRAASDSGGGPARPSTAWRAGADADGTLGDLTGVAAFVVAGDQLEGASENVNLGGFLEGIYTLRLDGRPILMPVVRVDWVQDDGGVNNLQSTLDLSSYVFENVRVGGEVSYLRNITGADGGSVAGAGFIDASF